MNKKFDVFISYRRNNGGYETANILHDRLSQAGYKVFMDIENLRSGKFNKQLYQQIDNCKDFIVVLGPDSLERCHDEDDWVRLEIAHAIQSDKNIIPVFLRNFKRPEEPLPEDIAEILNYEGIEASQELFSAFLERLKRMMVSKRHFTWNRIRKQLLFIIIPVLILAGTIIYIDYLNRRNEQIQLEQVSKQVVSEIAAGFGKGNELLSTIDEANIEWKKFHAEYAKSKDPSYKKYLIKDLLFFVDYKLKQISDTTKLPDIRLTEKHEELLAKNRISVEDIKAAKMMFLTDIEQTQEYLLKIKYWLSVPDMSWPLQIDEYMDILASINKEMINAGIFGFNELILEMPVSVREVYSKFSPNLTKYTYEMDYSKTRNELESRENMSINKIHELIGNLSVIVGDENKIVSWMSNQLDSLKYNKNKDQVSKKNAPQIDSMKQVVAEKKTALKQKRSELDEKKQAVRDSYQRILQKCSFDKSEDPGMMWGKIIFLAQFGYSQIETEKNCKAEYERLKNKAKEKGVDPNSVEPITSTISSKEIFQEVQKRLDLYSDYNKASDSNISVFVSAAKRYYALVGERKLEPVGVLVIGTENNTPHPFLKVGDIIIERKGKVIDRNETYAKLKEDPSPNKLKVIRFIDGKINILSETISPDCKVLVGMMDLWDEKKP